MSVSKYLPPFSTDERAAMTPGGATVRRSVDPAAALSDPEATYADFLGDEVED